MESLAMIFSSLFLCFLISVATTKESITDIRSPGKGNVSPEKKNGTNLKPEVNENDGCKCVPYYLCNATSEGLIDRHVTPVCEDYLDICCDERFVISLQPKPTVRNVCGQRNPEGVGFRITGSSGREAQYGEFPWMVMALLKRSVSDNGTDEMVYHCGGALLHESVVLTAAHCVTIRKLLNTSELELYVRAGEWDTQTTSEIFPHQDRKVARIIIHPEFNVINLSNNFAILVLEKPVKIGDNVGTVCLPPPGEVPVSRECFICGWGKDRFGKKGLHSIILRKMDLPIVADSQCINLLRKTGLGSKFTLHDSFVCAGGVIDKDTCIRDGGSPLVCPIEGKPGTYEVTGLSAWGIGCGDETPGVYSGVAYARSWIDETMAKLNFTIH